MMPAFPKSAQTGRQPARRRRARNSTLAAPTEPLAPQSAKRAAVYEAEYLGARARFLQRHRECQVKARGCTRWSIDVHHRRPRSRVPGDANLLDESMWVAVCRACHQRITDNPKWAEEHGWLSK